MAIEYKALPVYQQKQKILDCIENNQVVIVESPTGSGKTTQIPVILYEAGFANNGIIGITQPRRIAALSVSEFISHQLGTSYPGLVGYKMRFEDKTDSSTRIKIMTDGILLQEMKLDPWLSKYSVIMVDEAHERSLNIDFVLGLLKRILKERKDFRVIVSSATMNTQAFSEYFNNAPIVSIDTVTYPVSVIYDPIPGGVTTASEASSDLLIHKISSIVSRVLDNKDEGGILIFLPGEKAIKECLHHLDHSPFARKLHLLPLYGRLAKEEQERVFEEPPEGKKKVIISTNIAETSVTISDISTVIDSGIAKLIFYNPRTYTSSLVETSVSKASCNQRKGRAGRTHEGICYRLYSRKDFETRELYTKEEIYRTDLSEVVLQMADLGISDFYNFDFIASPGQEGIIGAVDTLKMLGALDSDNTLSSIGKMMVNFPLEPRISRIVIEAIMRYPNVLDKALIAASFLSTNSPFILPQNEEMEARKAHHRFRDMQGDFGTYLNLFYAYQQTKDRENFCKKNYLDNRVMAEIENINFQLIQIVNEKMGIPYIENKNGSMVDYLSCVAAGMIQFVCMKTDRENYQSLTASHICIHPGSVMFKQNPVFFVAGEIVRTSRIFAMSVSPLTKAMLNKIRPRLYEDLLSNKKSTSPSSSMPAEKPLKVSKGREKQDEIASENALYLGGYIFDTKKIAGKKTAILPIKNFISAAQMEKNQSLLNNCGNLRCKIITQDKGCLLENEKLSLAITCAKNLELLPISEKSWNRKLNVNIYNPIDKETLIFSLDYLLKVAIAKQKNKEYGFITLFTDSKGCYWYKVSRGFHTALSESHSSLETLIEEDVDFTEDEKNKINEKLALVNKFY